MKKFISTLLFSAACMVCGAQGQTKFNLEGNFGQGMTELLGNEVKALAGTPGGTELTISPQGRLSVPKKAGKTYSLKYVFKWDEEMCSPYQLQFTGGEGVLYASYNGKDTLEAILPPGIYDADAQFTRYRPADGQPEGMYFVLHTIDLQKDTVVVFDASTADNPIVFNNYKPNGELCKLKIGDNNAVGQFVELEPGNVNDIAWWMYLAQKPDGIPLTLNIVTSDRYITPERNQTETMFYVNKDCGDRFMICGVQIVDADNTFYIIKHKSDDMDDLHLQNDPANYVNLKEQFANTPLGLRTELAHTKGFDLVETFNEAWAMGLSATSDNTVDDGKVDFYVDMPREDGYGNYNVLITVNYADYGHEVVETVPYRHKVKKYYSTKTPFLSGNAEKLEYIVRPLGLYRYNPGMGNVIYYPGHPRFTYSYGEAAIASGAGSPMLLTHSRWFTDTAGTDHEGIDVSYIGRKSETIGSHDFGMTDCIIRYNGEEVDYGMSAKNHLLTNAAYLDNPGGIYEVEFSNENVLVDDEYGYNLTTMHIDMSEADHVAPAFTMLQLRDADGIVSDRFESAEGSQLRFSAGDFTYNAADNREDRGWFTCQPLARVEVAFAPRNTENWLPLNAVEKAEYYTMPGFGHYYEADLSGIAVAEADSWFDLKLRITDASGNWQEQVLSPAFKVAQPQEGRTAIHAISSDRQTGRIFNLNGQQLTGTGSSGIYIIDGKKVVR